MGGSLAKSRLDAAFVVRMIGIVLFAYFFFGFMLLPCLNTLTSIFTTTNAEGVRDPFAVIRFFFAGSMGRSPSAWSSRSMWWACPSCC
mgnify:CR=1 FL=1